MRLFIGMGLIGCFLFGAVQSFSYEPAGICREPECGRTGNDRANRDRARRQDSNKPQENPGETDRSPCGKNPPDKGFVYSTGNGKVRSDPSASSDAVGQLPGGSRLVYDRIDNSGGERWYHINTPGFAQGWVPSSDVACTRPQAPPPRRPNRVQDCNILPGAKTTSPGPTGARGFASEECQQDPAQEPVSLLETPVQLIG